MKRRLLGLCLAFALLFGISANVGGVTTSMAAGTVNHSVKLFVGEKLPIPIEKGGLKSVKTSQKSIVKVKKENEYGFYMIAKKAGTATVTAKIKKVKHIYNVTVSEAKLVVSQESLVVKNSYYGNSFNSSLTFKIENKTAFHVGSATVKYSLKDTTGKVVENGSFVVNCFPPGSAAYHTVDYAMKETALKSSEASIESWIRDPNYDYVDMSSKFSVKQDPDNAGVYVITSNADVEAAGVVDIMFCDSDGAVMYMETTSFYLPAGGSSNYTLKYVPEGVKADIVVRAAQSIYKGV